jgi:hypothetical protein
MWVNFPKMPAQTKTLVTKPATHGELDFKAPNGGRFLYHNVG